MAIEGHHQEIKKHSQPEHTQIANHHDLIHHAYGDHTRDAKHLPTIKSAHAADKHIKAVDTYPPTEHHSTKNSPPHEQKESVAQRHWEEQHAKFVKGALTCKGEWTTLIQGWVTHNETSNKTFNAYTPNDAGHGISVGLLQWNQKKGSLPELIDAWHDKDPAKFLHLFGKYSEELLNPKFVQQVDFVHNPILNNGVKHALHDKQYQHVQLDIREQHVEHSCVIARKHGFKSLGARAEVADLSNQIGNTGVVEAIQRVPRNKPESVRLGFLRRMTEGRPGGEKRDHLLEAKVTHTWHEQATSYYG